MRLLQALPLGHDGCLTPSDGCDVSIWVYPESIVWPSTLELDLLDTPRLSAA